MRSALRVGAGALGALAFLLFTPIPRSFADDPAGGQDPPERPGPSALASPGTTVLDPLVQAVVLITEVGLL
jgi:hypothetical protein